MGENTNIQETAEEQEIKSTLGTDSSQVQYRTIFMYRQSKEIELIAY